MFKMADHFPHYYHLQVVNAELAQLFILDPLDPRIDLIFKEYELPQINRHDVCQQDDILYLIETRIDAAKKAYENEQYETVATSFKREIRDDGLRLTTKALLAAHPRLVRRLAIRFHLNVTKNLEVLIENYRRRYYTRQCQFYHGPYGCIRGAARNGHIDVVRSFLSHPGIKDLDTVLASAADKGRIDIVKLLLTDSRVSSIHVAISGAAQNDHFDVVGILLSSPLSDRIHLLGNVINHAAAHNRFDIVERLRLDPRVFNLNMVLERAAKYDNLEMVRLLLPDQRLTQVETACHIAAGYGYMDIVRLLIHDPRIVEPFYITEYIARRNNPDMIKLLLTYQGRINLDPAIRACIESDLKDMFILLIQDPRVIYLGEFLYLAAKLGRLEMVVILRSDPRATKIGIDDALAIATKRGFFDIAKVLSG